MKEANLKGNVLYAFKFSTLWKKQCYGERKIDIGCQNFRKRTRKTEDRELSWQVVFCVKM